MKKLGSSRIHERWNSLSVAEPDNHLIASVVLLSVTRTQTISKPQKRTDFLAYFYVTYGTISCPRVFAEDFLLLVVLSHHCSPHKKFRIHQVPFCSFSVFLCFLDKKKDKLQKTEKARIGKFSWCLWDCDLLIFTIRV